MYGARAFARAHVRPTFDRTPIRTAPSEALNHGVTNMVVTLAEPSGKPR